MMAENPNFWWSLSGKPPLVSQQPSNNFMSPPPMQSPQPPSSFFPPQYLFGASPPPLPPSSLIHHDHNQDHFPLSWSQLLMSGFASDDQELESGGTSSSNYGQFKKLESWEDHQILNSPSSRLPAVGVKQELDQSSRQFMYDNSDQHGEDDELQACSSTWSSQVHLPVPSVGSTTNVSSLSFLEFSTNKRDRKNYQHTKPSSECNGTSSSGTPAKKARVQPSSSQPPLKVRKEKLGDRITALHQMVSPFGKTDTASVLLEAIGHIRFLEAKIQALSSPYLGNASGSIRHQQHNVKRERKSINSEESGQDTAEENGTSVLRSRGLCVVPVSFTDHIDLGTNNGSDYWAPGLGGGGGGVGF